VEAVASNFLEVGLVSRQMFEYRHHKYEARVMISPSGLSILFVVVFLAVYLTQFFSVSGRDGNVLTFSNLPGLAYPGCSNPATINTDHRADVHFLLVIVQACKKNRNWSVLRKKKQGLSLVFFPANCIKTKTLDNWTVWPTNSLRCSYVTLTRESSIFHTTSIFIILNT